jgi:hypothetical protein
VRYWITATDWAPRFFDFFFEREVCPPGVPVEVPAAALVAVSDA